MPCSTIPAASTTTGRFLFGSWCGPAPPRQRYSLQRLGYLAARIPNAVLQSLSALLQSTGWQQDYLCRCLGDCIFAERLDPETMGGKELDIEVGDLLFGNPESAPPPGRSWFSYVRYNRTCKKKEMLKILEDNPHLKRIDAADAIPRLRDIGEEYAEKNVKIEHLV
jgi:hypothetical protein